MAGAKGKVAGKAREVKGAATGNKAEEAKGKAQGARGEGKSKVDKATE
jgi:uncharacterized protein YjbJ (UPF0337 family)